MITASVGVDSSLLLEPAHELLFPLPDATMTRRTRCCLTLTNLSPLNDVVFRVRTRNPDAFTVRPTHGLLAPGKRAQVIITATERTCERLGAMDPQDLMTRQSSQLFLVQSVEREEEVQVMEPLDSNSSSSLRNFWKKVSRDCVTENKMVCRFAAATSGVPLAAAEISQDNDLFSTSMSSISKSAQESQSNCNGNRMLSMSSSSQETRLSRSGSSEQGRLNRSFSNQFTPPEERQRDERRSRNQSFASDASFVTTIEPPMPDRRSETRMSASSNRSDARTTTRLRDSVLSSISVSDTYVSDTMLSAQTSFSTDTAAGEPTHQLGPLQYHTEPSDVLAFNVKPRPRFWGTTSLFVVNASQKDCLAFKVRTSNQSGYVVKPSRGVVSMTNAQEVTISLCAPRDESSFDPAAREAKDGFMIEVANISQDKYVDLMKLDERKRTQELSSLWSLLPRSDRDSTMLSVKLKTETIESDINTRYSFESESSDARRRSNSASNRRSVPTKSLNSVEKSMEQLSTSSSTDESVANEKPGSMYRYSDSDESAFTVAPSVTPSEVDKDESDNNVDVLAAKLRDSAVIIVSADRMDTVDFSNPKLSFFI